MTGECFIEYLLVNISSVMQLIGCAAQTTPIPRPAGETILQILVLVVIFLILVGPALFKKKDNDFVLAEYYE
jgi:hypothetical protein